MGRAGKRWTIGAAAVATVSIAVLACTPFEADSGARPAPTPEAGDPVADAAGPVDGGASADVISEGGTPGATVCGPFQCPPGAILCEDFEHEPLGSSAGWIVQQAGGTVSSTNECTGKALSGNVPAASNAEERTARVVRTVPEAADRRELFVDLDLWVEPKGAFTKFGYGSVLFLSAVADDEGAGFTGLSFSPSGLEAVVRDVGSNAARPVPMSFGKWVHVTFHVKFDETLGLVEVALDGTIVASANVKTLNGSVDRYDLGVGALTDEDATPELTVKVDNVVLR